MTKNTITNTQSAPLPATRLQSIAAGLKLRTGVVAGAGTTKPKPVTPCI